MLYIVAAWRVDLLCRRGHGPLLFQHHHRQTGAHTDGLWHIIPSLLYVNQSSKTASFLCLLYHSKVLPFSDWLHALW